MGQEVNLASIKCLLPASCLLDPLPWVGRFMSESDRWIATTPPLPGRKRQYHRMGESESRGLPRLSV